MARYITIAGAQLGPIARNDSRQVVVSRLVELMREAKARRRRHRDLSRIGADDFLPALVDGG